MYRAYWVAWGCLLVLTVTMVALDQAQLPHQMYLGVMLGAMVVKASVIAAFFMHLRSERWGLVLGIALGLPINAAILYVLIVPDALRILRMMGQR